MWAPFLFCLFVGLTSAEYGWKAGTQYSYEVRGRIFTGLFQKSDQYSGMVMRSKLSVQAKTDSDLSLQIHGAEFAEIHSNLSNGWTTDLHDEELQYSPLPIHSDPFEVRLKRGVVKGMIIDSNLPVWEINMLKSIVSLLQVDTQGENLEESKMNLIPSPDDASGVYKTMEDSIHGKYETTYDVSELPEYVMLSRPEMVPLPHLRGSGKIINIVKTRNFSNSEHHMVYHHGMGGAGKGEPGSNHMGNSLTRSSGSRIVISGNTGRYVIQSSITDEKIILAPHLHNSQKGVVATRLNLTLQGVSAAQGPPAPVTNPMMIENLVYQDNTQKETQSVKQSLTKSHSDENSSSSSSSSQSQRRSSYESSSSSSSDESSSSMSSSSGSFSSESLSSSEEYYHGMSPLDQPHQASLLFFHDGWKGNSIRQLPNFNGVEKVIQLSREMAYDIQNPDMITGENTLSKFSTLIRLIRIMSATELRQTTEKMYSAEKDGRTSQDHQAWVAFRDAVSQAGSGPALLTIKDWIKTNKVQGEEAAQLIAVLPNSVRFPTMEYIGAFFELVQDSQVECQNWLNTTAILSFADLIRVSMVDSKDMHDRFPVHMFGPTKTEESESALEKYIEYFDRKLQTAVDAGDSAKIQVYINALGNIAHQRILASYEPYLEGQKPISNFQRLVMVASLDKITKVYPLQSRAVLYRIYQNSAESPEIRTAAVMQIMKTNPPAQMLQRMAQQTNFEHSKQVCAAVKSAIESAARQTINKYNWQLTKNARSAVNLLSPEEFGLQNSKNFIRSFIVKEEHLAYKHHLSYIQSRDSILPKSVFYSLKRNLGGFKRDAHEMQFMTSSVDHLIEQLSEQVYSSSQREHNQKKTRRSDPRSEWSLEKVYRMLNFEDQVQEQLEGNLLITAFGGKRSFHFDNHTIEKLPQIAQELKQALTDSQNRNFTKFYNQYSWEIALPTALGLPFSYSMEVPTLISFGGHFQASFKSNQHSNENKLNRINMPGNMNVDGACDIVYSAKRQGRMGFVTPFNGKVYTSGLEKNIQIRIPVHTTAKIDIINKKLDLSIEPLQKDEQHKIFELSSVAYTTSYGVWDIRPHNKLENTKQLSSETSNEYSKTIGQSVTGFAWDINMKGDVKPVNMVNMHKQLERSDIVSLFLYGEMESDISNRNITVVYNPEKSSADKMKLSLKYMSQKTSQDVDSRSHKQKRERGYNPKNEENLALRSATNRDEKQKRLLDNAMTGINDAEGRMISVSVAFEGKEKKEYDLSIAYASNPSSEDSRFLVYASNSTSTDGTQKFQAALQLEMKSPRVPLVNFREALKADPTSEIMGRLDFGQNTPLESSMFFEGKMMSTPECREYVRKQPLSTLCEKQMQDGYSIQPACRNVTDRANYLDKYEFAISYQNLPGKLQNLSHTAYSAARYLWSQYNNENNSNENSSDGRMQVEVRFGHSLRKMNITLRTPSFQSEFKGVPIHEWIRPALIMHPHYGMKERLGEKIFHGQYNPVCALDGDRVSTFDNRSYEVNLGSRPHVLAQSIINDNGFNKLNSLGNQNNYFSVIARRNGGSQLEIYVLAGDNVLEIHPAGAKSANFRFNEVNVAVQESSAVPLSDSSGQVIMQVFYVSQGSYRVLSRNFGFELVWTGNSVRVQVSNGFRGKIRGLCGNYDGESYNDFLTPRGYIVNSTEAFTRSYVLSESSDASMGKPITESSKYWEEVVPGNVISPNDSGKDHKTKGSQKIKATEDKKMHENLVTDYKVKIVQEPGKTCFSLRPQLSCGANARAANIVEKTIDFHCINKSNASKHWEKMVALGATPDFTKKGANHRATLKLPQQCIPN